MNIKSIDTILDEAQGPKITEEMQSTFNGYLDIMFPPVDKFYEGGSEQMLKDFLEYASPYPEEIYKEAFRQAFRACQFPTFAVHIKIGSYDFGGVWDFFEPFQEHVKHPYHPQTMQQLMRQAVFDIFVDILMQGHKDGRKRYFHTGRRGMTFFDRPF